MGYKPCRGAGYYIKFLYYNNCINVEVSHMTYKTQAYTGMTVMTSCTTEYMHPERCENLIRAYINRGYQKVTDRHYSTYSAVTLYKEFGK